MIKNEQSSSKVSLARLIFNLILFLLGLYLVYFGYLNFNEGKLLLAIGGISGGLALSISAISKSFLFNLFSILLGLGFTYVGYNAYLIENWPIAFLGLVGGAVVILVSFMFIILKVVIAINS
ncbi:MAG: hypothetical protein ACP5KW_00330 [Thermoproteota archaeon]|jgi:hypothetical protein